MMKLSPRSTGLKKSFLKNTEKLKVNILEKWHVSISRIIRMERSATAVIHDCSNHHHYIAAYTNATQTELDTLSAGKIITKQFKADYPHVKKLHRRTDNAGNFLTHSTSEIEKVICDRVSIFISELFSFYCCILFYSLALSY